MAAAAAADPTKGKYWETMFDATTRGKTGFEAQAKTVYTNIKDILGGKQLELVCELERKACKGGPYWAFANDAKKEINFCKRFFSTTDATADADFATVLPTEKRITDMKALADKTKATLVGAHRTKAGILLHEATHFTSVMAGLHAAQLMGTRHAMAKDYAYGYTSCYELAHHAFYRDCVPYAKAFPTVFCGASLDSQGLCDAAISVQNADTWAFVASGVYFTQKLGFEVALPALSEASRTAAPTTAQCAASSSKDVADAFYFDYGSS